MNKKNCIGFASATVVASFLLSGCQALSGYQQIEDAKSAMVWSGQIIPLAGEVNIACAGTYHCEITQIDKKLVIAADTHRPIDSDMLVSMISTDGTPYSELNAYEQAKLQEDTPALLNNQAVKLVPLSASGIPGLINYYARVKPVRREVHVNFYPENNLGYIERFAMIDEFKEPGTYLLQAYRQKLPQDDNSLLDNASPAPLCIDLTKDDLLQRRFCKNLDTASQGEFVEVDLSSEIASEPAS